VFPSRDDDAESEGEAGEFDLMQKFDATGLEKDWEKIYAKEIALLQCAAKRIPEVPAEDARDIENLIRKTMAAMNRRNRDEAAASAGELEDLLYYLEDSN